MTRFHLAPKKLPVLTHAHAFPQQTLNLSLSFSGPGSGSGDRSAPSPPSPVLLITPPSPVLLIIQRAFVSEPIQIEVPQSADAFSMK